MTKRFQIWLTISAAALFMLAFLLGVFGFSQERSLFWEDIKIPRIATIIAAVTAFGFSLGLFFFRQKTYIQRLSWTVPIAFILFSLAVITISAIDYYGIAQKYNYFTAKRDIKDGKIQVLTAGLRTIRPDWEKQQAAQQIVEKRFGYKSVHVGCIVYNGIAIYNDVMADYLDKANGKDWRIKARRMRDSILQSDTHK